MRINPTKPVIKPEVCKIEDQKNKKTKTSENPQKIKASKEYLVESELRQKVNNYKRKDLKVHQNAIGQLKAESKRHYENFKKLIVQLIEKQGVKLKNKSDREGATFELSQEVKDKAAVAVTDEGEFGSERLSERIVNFAKALSGGDKSKIGLLRDAIQEGFSQAAQKLGGLPGISLTTYDLVIDKLDAWEKEE